MVDNSALTALREDGVVQLGSLSDSQGCARILSHLANTSCFPFHNAGDAKQLGLAKAHPIALFSQGQHYAAYDHADIANAPGILSMAANERVVSLADGYFGGCGAVIYGLTLWWSFPNQTRSPVAQRLHRDPTRPVCALFVYLTDVGLADGPHVYVKGSHDKDKFERKVRGVVGDARDASALIQSTYDKDGNAAPLDENLPRLIPEDVLTITGAAGTAMMTDPYGLHKGALPQASPRLILCVRYTIKPPNLPEILANRRAAGNLMERPDWFQDAPPATSPSLFSMIFA